MKLNPFNQNPENTELVNYDESVLQQGRFWMKTVTWTLIGTTVFGVAWLALAKTEEIVVATGKLEPIGSVKDIQMPMGGVADKIPVKEGDPVEKGDVLMLLDTQASEAQRQRLEKTIALKQKQLQFKKKEKDRYLQVNNEEVSMLESNLKLQSEILNRFAILEKAGATSELQYLSQQNSVAETRGRLMQTRADRFRQVALLDQQNAQLSSELADLRGKLAENKVTQRYQKITSPVDGVVFDLKPTTQGFTAQSTQTVMKVVPYDSLEAKVEVPSNKIGFVSETMKADISIDSYPSTDFGVLRGEVTRIGSDALPPDQQEQRQQISFPVTIALENQKLQLRSGKELTLRVGMSITANIKLREVSYLQLLLGEFQDKAESLQRL